MRDALFARAQQHLGAEANQVLVLGMNRQQCAAFAGGFERAHVIAGTRFEALHHENFETRDAAFDDARDLGNCLRRRIEDGDVKSVVDSRAPLGLRTPFFDRAGQRSAGGLECVVDYRRDAACGCRNGARIKVVGRVQIEHLGVEMSMRVDGARHQDHPVGVDCAARRLERSGQCDLRDLSGCDADVRRSHAARRYGSRVDDREIEHRGLSD